MLIYAHKTRFSWKPHWERPDGLNVSYEHGVSDNVYIRTTIKEYNKHLNLQFTFHQLYWNHSKAIIYFIQLLHHGGPTDLLYFWFLRFLGPPGWQWLIVTGNSCCHPAIGTEGLDGVTIGDLTPMQRSVMCFAADLATQIQQLTGFSPGFVLSGAAHCLVLSCSVRTDNTAPL